MNREIKFRGLRTDGKGWVYGNLIKEKSINIEGKIYWTYYIREFTTLKALSFKDTHKVIHESVGQFIGERDKNGVDIYEGDELKDDLKENKSGKSVSVVKYASSHACFLMERQDGALRLFVPNSTNTKSVIGNIHGSAAELKEESK